MLHVTCMHCVFLAVKPYKVNLIITTADSQHRLLNPDKVTVGNASDLAVEVQCSSSKYRKLNNKVSWLYDDRRAVSNGLRAFGTTQGDGILRIYPATVLSGGSGTKFWCFDTKNNESLRVTLVLRKFPNYLITFKIYNYHRLVYMTTSMIIK